MFGFYKDFTLCPQMFRSSPYVQSVGIRCDPKVRRTKLNPSPPPPPGDPRCAPAGCPDMGSITRGSKSANFGVTSDIWGHLSACWQSSTKTHSIGFPFISKIIQQIIISTKIFLSLPLLEFDAASIHSNVYIFYEILFLRQRKGFC